MVKNILNAVIHLFYPHICEGCGSDIISQDNLLCLNCINDLPHTNFVTQNNNPIEKMFYGRIDITAAFCQFYFTKESIIQNLIHQLKYKGNIKMGFYLGEMLGQSILQSNRFQCIDYLIPLPLFSEKQKKRGYNQAEIICKGIEFVTKIPILNNNLIRQKFTETQTKKHRDERWQNVEGSFTILNSNTLINKNILLVDDVITTGATIEACLKPIQHIEGIKIFIATVAYASK